jgi:hypothetical protein
MWAGIKALARSMFSKARCDIGEAEANAQARANLDRLRTEELSVGAAFRRGEPVTHAPGVTTGTNPKANTLHSLVSSASVHTRTPERSRPSREQDGDFATSFVLADVTGSIGVGFVAGGSITGAVLGAEVAAASDNS